MNAEAGKTKLAASVTHDAFISYSRRDSDFARALERRLEKYRPPPGLGLPRRYLDIFRDETDFIGPDYHESLREHLSASAALIVLCSPHARASEYVAEEIQEFARRNGTERIVPILVSGQPNNELDTDEFDRAAFPDALCELFQMPLAANYLDFRIGKDRFDKGEYFDAWHTVLANLFGVSRSKIESRDRKRRARRLQLIGGLSGAIILVLSAALVFALLSRAEAVRQAVAARHQTSTRLAVQALERLDDAPETALALAIDAVETYHEFGDPPVPRAMEALHKARLGFGGSVPAIQPQPGDVQPVWSPNLRWIAQSSDTGAVRLAASGTAGVPLAAPDHFLADGERWSDGLETQLRFTGTGLAALRGIQVDDDQWIDKSVVWHWPMNEAGIDGAPTLVARLDDAYWYDSNLVVSPDGRWLSWSDGGDLAYLGAVGASNEPLEIVTKRWLLRFRTFSADSTEFAVMTERGVQIIELRRPDPPAVEVTPAPAPTPGGIDPESIVVTARSGVRVPEHIDPNALEAVPTRLLKLPRRYSQYADMAVSTRYGRRREDGSYPRGLAKVAAITENGDVDYWNLDADTDQSSELGSVFSAYAEWLSVGMLRSSGLHVSFEFSPAGGRLLAAVEHDLDNFGIAAWIDLADEDGWKPLPVERPGSDGSISRFGSDGYYDLKSLKRLGASDAWWLHDTVVLTSGMDGTLWQWNLDRGRSRLIDEQVTALAVPSRNDWLIIGTRDGKVKLRNMEETGNVRELRFFDEPVQAVAQIDRPMTLVATDTSGHTRFWSMGNPVFGADDADIASLDWRWFGDHYGRGPTFWDLQQDNPFRMSAEPGSRIDPKAVAVSGDEQWAATIAADDTDAGELSITLSRIASGRTELVPDITRRYTVDLPEDHEFSSAPDNLHVADGKARLLLSSGRFSRKSIWQVDVLDPDTLPVLVVDAEQGFEMRSVTPGLERMAVGESGRNRDTPDSVRVLDLDDPAGDPVIVVDGTAWGDLSPDGRWFNAGSNLFDLHAAGSPAVLSRESMELNWPYSFVFGAGRPPMFVEDGRLWAVDEAGGTTPLAVTGDEATVISEVAWDASADWLAIGSAQGDLWTVQVSRQISLESLVEIVQGAMANSPLPAPWLEEARNEISLIVLLPESDMAFAGTDNDHLVLWRGNPEDGWSDPMVFDDAVLQRAGRGLSCRPDGRQCLIGGQFVSFIEEQALAMARDLQLNREQ